MTRIALVLIACFMVLVSSAPRAQDADRLLKAAMNTELVDGNLQAAIEQYKKVVHAGSRALAAQALVRMAECYQKLGDAESKNIYERIIQEYSDQKDSVAQARRRLAATVEPPLQQVRSLVWTDSSTERHLRPIVSGNGRYIAYSDRYAVYVDDLVNGTAKRVVITGDANGYAKQLAFASEARRLVYTWHDRSSRHDDLRTVDLFEAGLPQSRILFRNEDIATIIAPAVSPDGKWIAATLVRRDGSAQIGLISMADGLLRVLKSVDWQGTNRLSFSPDNKYIGFDLAASTSDRRPDVFVLAIDGSREYVVASSPYEDTMVAWSPDGKRILFGSDRLGTHRLWSVDVTDLKAPGEPQAIQPPIPWSPGITVASSGALFYGAIDDAAKMQIASFDFGTDQLLSTPVDVSFGGHTPAWSPDGKALAYVSDGIAIRSLEERDRIHHLRPSLAYFSGLRWSPDGRSIAVTGSDANGRRGVFRIDAATAEVSLLVPRGGVSDEQSLVDLSSDGKRVYYQRGSLNGPHWTVAIIERDLSSGKERKLIEGAGIRSSTMSPDSQYLATVLINPTDRAYGLLLVPVTGSEPRLVVKGEGSELSVAMWAPDSRTVFVRKHLSTGSQELWRVSVDGGEPEKANIELNSTGSINVHPDGHRIAFVSGVTKSMQIWKVEGVLTQSR